MGRRAPAPVQRKPVSAPAAVLAEEGQALLAALALVTVLGLTVTGLAVMATNRMTNARLAVSRLAAEDAADSGAEMALARLGQLWARWGLNCAGKQPDEACPPGDAPAELRGATLPALFTMAGGASGFSVDTAVDAPTAAGDGPGDLFYTVTSSATGQAAPGSPLLAARRVRALADSPFRFLVLARGDVTVSQTCALFLCQPTVYLHGHVRAGGTVAANGSAIYVSGQDVHGTSNGKAEGVPRPAATAGNEPYERRYLSAADAACPSLGQLTSLPSGDVRYHCDLTVPAGTTLALAGGQMVAVEGNLTIYGTVYLPAGAVLYLRRPRDAAGACADPPPAPPRGSLDARAGSSLSGDGEIVVGGDAVLLETRASHLRLYAVRDCLGDEDNGISLQRLSLLELGTSGLGQLRLYLFSDPCADPARCSISVSDLTAVGLLTSATLRGSIVSGGNVNLDFSGLNLGTVTVEYDPGMWRALPGGLEPARAFQVFRWRSESM